MNVDAIPSLALFVLASAAAALPGVVFRPGAWYRALAKPSWCPPSWLFGPVWLALYLSIAIAGWLVWREPGWPAAAPALAIYGGHLLLNGLWSAVFFGLRRPDWAFGEIVCLWLSVLATIVAFYPQNAAASYLLIPYACWVSFAVALNFSVWRLNPGRSSW
jgi:tryptophan-rich sensory protein